jgi:hypothetical protein
MNNRLLLKQKKGFVTLVSVIILGTMGVVIVTGNLSVVTDNIVGVSTFEQSKQARALADSCAEIAINKLKLNNEYTGNEEITLPFGICTIGSISGVGNTNRSFQTTSKFKEVTKKVDVRISIVNPITEVDLWEEVP